ncbi:MAG: F0F1 ATP synthase subunit delta [Clostridia bacterium]|nr:F0F1 ATP synthase subunit delta [Clostridia bacterium]MBR0509261.1 F0F1 ATP synthase subunit delta [Clostridia bacterium]MBR0537684.1 F0F1 ATP synthase subunit delta [Clostridia bacterium]
MKKCVITTGETMSEETFRLLTERMRKRYGDDLWFERKYDPDIIGGFFLDFDGQIYDYTLSTQLRRLKEQLMQ